MPISNALLSVGSRVGRTEPVRKLAYAIRNRVTFTDLYQHDRMLADTVRMDAYRAAIAKHVGPDDVVVDLGTGSGILAFLAARNGARRVHAVEHGEMIELAMATAKANSIANVEFHRTHSSRFDPGEPVDILLHEQIGDAAFDERVIDNIADLRDRLLKPGGKILPAYLSLYIEPVELTDGADAPFLWQQEIDGISFANLASLADQQPQSYRYRLFRPFPFKRLLAKPEPVVEIDLYDATPASLPKSISARREAIVDGRLDGFAVYFEARFDDEIAFSSSPEDKITSWATPLLRVSPRSVEAGEPIQLALSAEDLARPDTWRWNDA